MLFLVFKYEVFKTWKFCQILHFVLKVYDDLKSYQIMLTILGFSFLYNKLQLYSRCHAHYALFICGKGFLKF
jgi:hypothetical protein